MNVDLKDYMVHLGSHDFGVERKSRESKFNGQLLSSPQEASIKLRGTELPFVKFSAVNQEAAEQFVKTVNWFVVTYNIDALDIAILLNSADKLTGKRGGNKEVLTKKEELWLSEHGSEYPVQIQEGKYFCLVKREGRFHTCAYYTLEGDELFSGVPDSIIFGGFEALIAELVLLCEKEGSFAR